MNMFLFYEEMDEQQRLNGGYILKGQPPLNLSIKIINNKIYNAVKVSVLISKMLLKLIDIAKNDILKNEATAIYVVNVRGEHNSPSKVVIRNNCITEISNGYGIHLENCSATLDHNELKKNSSHAICISS